MGDAVPQAVPQAASQLRSATPTPRLTQGQTQRPAQRPAQRIVLTGFMGAGKSTVGRLLAARMQWKLIDVDAEIEASEGATIADLFRQHGEAHFRELEHQTIRRLLAADQLILAVGGGAIEDPRTRDLLFTEPGTHVVHLEVSLSTVLERCRGTEGLRPILADHTHLNNRYEQRLPLYRQAHLTIVVDSLNPDAVVEALLEALPDRIAIPSQA